MMRKVLLAAFLAAFAVAGGGAFGADVYYTGGGGGGGGGGGDAVGDGEAGGKGGSAVSNEAIANRGDTAGTGGAAKTVGNDAGSGTSEGGFGTGGATDTTTGVGGRGAGGQALGSAGSRTSVDYDSITDAIHILGGAGGDAGTGGSENRGGGGGVGGDAFVELVDGGTGGVVGNINIFGGDGGTGAATVNAKTGGYGGNGGNVDAHATALSVTTGKTITIKGGAAGDPTNATEADGGNGGSASLTADVVMLDGATVSVINGAAPTKVGHDADEDAATGRVGGNASFSVGTLAASAGGGTFSTAGGVAAGAGVGKRTINIGAVEAIAGDMELDFDTFDAAVESRSVGMVTVGDGKEFTVSNANGFAAGAGWNGGTVAGFDGTVHLQTLGRTTITGVTLDGASILVNTEAQPDSFEIDNTGAGAELITVGAGTTVSAATKVALRINAVQKADLQDGADDLVVFGAGDAGALDGAEFSIWNGAEEAKAVFADGLVAAADAAALVFAVDATENGVAYNTFLATPAMMALVNGGADMAERAVGSFSPMALTNSLPGGMQFGVFADMGAASIDVDTGSGVDTDSFHMLIGPGLRINNGTGKTDFGAFFEAGWGNYDAYSSVYRGEGDTEYYGGGLLLRHDTCFGLYAEATLRAGGSDADYRNLDGINTDFEMNASYIGGHFGLGYILRPTECSSWDFFAKGILTNVSDESALDKAGNTITVDDTTSFRTQMGAKYSYNFAQNAAFYVKGAWEHEFDGETGGAYNGVRIAKNSDMGGSSLIGELGVDVRLAERVTLGASVYGITGQRDGFGGNLNIGIGF